MFAHVQRERLGELAATRAVRRFDAGSVLFARGDPATRLLVVLEGDVSALVDHRNGAPSRYPLMSGPASSIRRASWPPGRTWPPGWPSRPAARSRSAPRRSARCSPQNPGCASTCCAISPARPARLAPPWLVPRRARPLRGVARWLIAASNSATTPLVLLPAGQQGIAEELALSRVTVNGGPATARPRWRHPHPPPGCDPPRPGPPGLSRKLTYPLTEPPIFTRTAFCLGASEGAQIWFSVAPSQISGPVGLPNPGRFTTTEGFCEG